MLDEISIVELNLQLMFEILETFIYVILSGLFCPRVWWIRDFEIRLWGSHSMYIYDIPTL